MVLQSTASVLCMACVQRIRHPDTWPSARVRPRRHLRRWLHRTRDRLAQMSCCGCCGWNVPSVGRIRRPSRNYCRPAYGRSASYPGRRCSFGTFATVPGNRRRKSSGTVRPGTCDGWRVRKISASGRYIPEKPFDNSSSWPGRRRAIRVRDRSLVALRLRSGDSHGRQIRCTPDWSENAVSGDHLWVPTSVSGDCCYVGDNDCTVSILAYYNLGENPCRYAIYLTPHSSDKRFAKFSCSISHLLRRRLTMKTIWA
uniref:Uncharacterized protein n=1 Tax=Anopheles culicifacies TaxID=139723 RepID=A0A182MFD5_9DIPT